MVGYIVSSFLSGHHLNDGLAQKIIRFTGKLLPELGLEVIVLVPNPDLDAIRAVVTLAEILNTGLWHFFVDLLSLSWD